jgi:hypothetical protein
MPWKPSDAARHTKKARTPKSKRAFAHASNSVLERTGDEGRAVRAGNAAAAKSAGKSKRQSRRSRRSRRS